VIRPVLAALDVDTAHAATDLAARLRGHVGGFKIGSHLFTAEGPAVVRELTAQGDSVFLDLKYHDIPNTVASAVRAAARLGVWMLNVHASGGPAMMRAARDALSGVARPPLLIGVTILTSLADADLPSIGLAGSAHDNAVRLARLARECGLDGVVCSAEEAPAMRAAAGADFTLVTPGIRLASDAKADQSRTVTPVEAVRLGADYLVIGRPITQSKDPVATLESIRASLEEKSRA